MIQKIAVQKNICPFLLIFPGNYGTKLSKTIHSIRPCAILNNTLYHRKIVSNVNILSRISVNDMRSIAS